MTYLILLAMTTSLAVMVLGGNILYFHVTSTGSYMKTTESLLNTLAPHHNITIFSIMHDDFPHPNVTVVPIKTTPVKNYFSDGLFEAVCAKGSLYITVLTIVSPTESTIDAVYQNSRVQELLAGNEHKYDMMITFGTFCELAYRIAHVLKIPLVQVLTTLPPPHVNDGVGNPPFLSSTYSMLSVDRPNTFYARLIEYTNDLFAHFYYNWHYMSFINRITNKYLPSNTPLTEEVHRNTSLFLVNVNSAMGNARLNMPHVIEFGSLHCKPPKPLSKSLQEFMNGSGENGVIYFSLGTSIQTMIPEHMRKVFLKVFQKLPQRVIWKFNEEMRDLPENVWVAKWFPQQDILGHNKTKLFISQAGVYSMQESAYHGVPVLALPIAFDQTMNALTANDLGYSEYIKFCKFTEEKFSYLINKMLSNPKYQQNAKKLSQLVRDQPQTNEDRVNWWIDYVIRHKGNPIIHQLPYRSWGLQRMDVDVVLFLFIALLTTLMLLSYFVYGIIKFLKQLKLYSATKLKVM